MEGPLGALAKLLPRTFEKPAQAKPAQEQAQAVAGANDGTRPTDAAAAKKNEKDETKENGEKNDLELSAETFEVGMKVVVIATKDKALYDGRSAMVTAVNKSSVWVRMLEGPENGNSVKRAFKQVRLPTQAVAPATVALAGTTALVQCQKHIT